MALKKDAQTDMLFRSILTLKSVEECYLYFEDLCTNKEICDLGQRLNVAAMLMDGSSYLKAAERAGVSSATVGRVKKCLDYGDGGYRMVLERLREVRDDGV